MTTDGHKTKFSWVRRLMRNRGSTNGGVGLASTATSSGSASSPSISEANDTSGSSFENHGGSGLPGRSENRSSGYMGRHNGDEHENHVRNDRDVSQAQSTGQSKSITDGASSHQSIGEDSYYASLESNSVFSQLQSADSRPSRVQIVDSRPHARLVNDNTNADNESVMSKTTTGSIKRRSNSNFTVPSISKTSITTMSDGGSTHTIPSSLLPFHQQQLLETASIITIASSSKQNNRRSFDTNASTMALAPESILSRNGSIDSYPAAPTKSISSSRKFSDGEDSYDYEGTTAS